MLKNGECGPLSLQTTDGVTVKKKKKKRCLFFYMNKSEGVILLHTHRDGSVSQGFVPGSILKILFLTPK